MPQESLPNIGPMSNDSPISGTSAAPLQSMLFVEVSPAKMSPWLAPEQDLKERDRLFGEKCSDSFAKLSPNGSWLKMSQGYFQAMVDGSLETFSETWPAQGTMRNGECYRRPEWELLTSDDEFLYWRTPQAQEAGARIETLYTKSGQPARPGERAYRKTPSGKMVLQSVTIGQQVRMWPTPNVPNGGRSPKGGMTRTGMTPDGKKRQVGLENAVKMWPTPQSCDGDKGTRSTAGHQAERDRRGNGVDLPTAVKFATPQSRDHRTGETHRWENLDRSRNLNDQIGGQLNPTWVEWLMGFPLEWTALDASEMQSFLKSRRKSGK